MKIIFEKRIADTNKTPLHKNFIIFIRGLAIENDMHEDGIYDRWQDYVNRCNAYDQSPVKSEFCQWYSLKSTEGLLQLV